METSIQLLAANAFLITGLSHIAQPRAWAEFFVALRKKGVPGVFFICLFTLPMGLFIVAFHNVWRGLPTILTFIGWAYCFKCLIYMVFPKVGLAALATICVDRPHKFVVAGIVMLVLSGICWWMWLNQP